MTATTDTATTDTATARGRRRSVSGPSSLGLLLLRLVLGVVFMAHGAQKVFGFGLEGTAGSFAGMGVPAADVLGPVVAFVELIGGALLILGLATRAVAVVLAVVMAVATVLVHLPAGFFAADGGIELTLVLGVAALALALTGAGGISVDRAVRRGR